MISDENVFRFQYFLFFIFCLLLVVHLSIIFQLILKESKPPFLISRDFLFQVFLFNFLFSSCFLFLVWSFIYLFSFIFLLLVWNFIYYFASFQNCCQWENIGTIDGKGVYSHCALQYDEDHFVFMGRKF